MSDLVIADSRPGGDVRCFYCHEAVGATHKPDCVCLTRAVRIRMVVEYEATVPRSWGKEMIEFHRNDGSWCADNAIVELEELAEREGCLCQLARFEYLGEVEEARDDAGHEA